MAEHIMASASVPEHYDYTLVPKEYDYTKNEGEKSLDIQENDLKNYTRFWDGGILSNTPLRELIQSHQDYWKDVEHVEHRGDDIPDLEVYIVDVWPSLEDYPVPSDLDGIRDRKNNFMYLDKTPYEEKVANIISDYYNLVTALMKLPKDKDGTAEINKILDKHTPNSRHRYGRTKKIS